MGDIDARQAAERIDTVEKRLAALHDLGVDTAALRSQLAFARTCLHEGRSAEIEGICEEVLAAARRLAEGGDSAAGGDGKQRTGRISRDQLAGEIRTVLGQGLFAKLLAEHRTGPDPRLEARLQAIETGLQRQLAEALSTVAQVRATAQAEQAALRAELLERLGAAAPASAASATAPGPAAEPAAPPVPVATVLESFASQTTAQQERFLAALGDGLRQLGDRVAQRPADDAAPPADQQPLAQALVALQQGLDRLAEALAQRPAAVAPAQTGPLTAGPDPWPAAAGDAAPASEAPDAAAVISNSTTRTVQALSTRTDKPAVELSRNLDTNAVRRIVVDEVDQQLGDRQAAGQGGGEPLMVFDPDQVRSLVEAEFGRLAAERPVEAAPAALPRESELRKALIALLPEAFKEEAVRRQLFALIALEAVATPGVLGELTGLRAFLRRELVLVAEELVKDGQPA
jgi:hypothetical protein